MLFRWTPLDDPIGPVCEVALVGEPEPDLSHLVALHVYASEEWASPGFWGQIGCEVSARTYSTMEAAKRATVAAAIWYFRDMDGYELVVRELRELAEEMQADRDAVRYFEKSKQLVLEGFK